MSDNSQKSIVNNFISRNERINKVKELLECGVSPREICVQLAVKWETIQSDIKILSIISKGSLSPEICAEKRIVIDDKFLSLDDETMSVYKDLIKAKKYKIAADYLKISIDIQKFRAKIWGLEEDLSKYNGLSQNINFNKIDVVLNKNDMRRMRKSISRHDENMMYYE